MLLHVLLNDHTLGRHVLLYYVISLLFNASAFQEQFTSFLILKVVPVLFS